MHYFKTTSEVEVVRREDGSVKNYYVGREGGEPMYSLHCIEAYHTAGNLVAIDSHGRPWVMSAA